MSTLLTTDSVSPADSFEYWREIICAVYVKLDAEPVGRQNFSGSVALSSWGDTAISRVDSEGQIVTRSPDGGSDDCLISLQLNGTGRATQAGRTAHLGPGDFVLYDATEHYELAFDDAFTQLVVQFPRETLIARNVHIESAVARTQRGTSGVGAVLRSFVESLGTHGPEIDGPQRGQLGKQILDFAAVAFSCQAPEASVIEFNRQRILTYVTQRLYDPALTVASVAEAFGVSARTVQKLFADDKLHLGARIRRARLEQAREALRDPLRQHQTIALVATNHGFAGPSQFSRAFSSAYGYSPTDYRNRTD